jgi:hypothetical protein
MWEVLGLYWPVFKKKVVLFWLFERRLIPSLTAIALVLGSVWFAFFSQWITQLPVFGSSVMAAQEAVECRTWFRLPSFTKTYTVLVFRLQGDNKDAARLAIAERLRPMTNIDVELINCGLGEDLTGNVKTNLINARQDATKHLRARGAQIAVWGRIGMSNTPSKAVLYFQRADAAAIHQVGKSPMEGLLYNMHELSIDSKLEKDIVEMIAYTVNDDLATLQRNLSKYSTAAILSHLEIVNAPTFDESSTISASMKAQFYLSRAMANASLLYRSGNQAYAQSAISNLDESRKVLGNAINAEQIFKLDMAKWKISQALFLNGNPSVTYKNLYNQRIEINYKSREYLKSYRESEDAMRWDSASVALMEGAFTDDISFVRVALKDLLLIYDKHQPSVENANFLYLHILLAQSLLEIGLQTSDVRYVNVAGIFLEELVRNHLSLKAAYWSQQQLHLLVVYRHAFVEYLKILHALPNQDKTHWKYKLEKELKALTVTQSLLNKHEFLLIKPELEYLKMSVLSMLVADSGNIGYFLSMQDSAVSMLKAYCKPGRERKLLSSQKPFSKLKEQLTRYPQLLSRLDSKTKNCVAVELQN